MSESVLVRRIIGAVNKMPGCRAKKIHGSVFGSGWPDVLAVAKGLAVFLEVKRPGKSMTRLQKLEMEKWRKAGAIVGVVYGVEEAEGMVRDAVMLAVEAAMRVAKGMGT